MGMLLLNKVLLSSLNLGLIPKHFYVIIRGECKAVFEDVIIRENKTSEYVKNSLKKNIPKPLHFGMRTYNEDVDDDQKSDIKSLDILKKSKGIYERNSFQNDLVTTKVLDKEQQKKFIAYKHHV